MKDLKRDQWSWSKLNDLGLQEFQALVVNHDQKSVLLKEDGNRWVMPAYLGGIDNYESCYLPEFVKEKVRKEVVGSLDLFVLRQVWREEMDVKKGDTNYTFEKAVILCESYTRPEVDNFEKSDGNGYVWIPLAKSAIYHLFPDAQKVIKEEIKWILRESWPENRLRWQHPGWMKRTTSWMEEVLLRKEEARLIKSIMAERSTPLGCVLWAETTKGKFFLKCTPPWQNDAAYTQLLSKIVPEYVRAPIEVDLEKQMMITSDYGNILIPAIFSGVDKTQLTHDYVKLQRRAMGRIEELVCAGMPDFREEALMTKMDWVANHAILDTFMKRTECKEAVEFFQKNLDKLKGKVQELYRTGIPSTVTHNDLALSNVYKQEGSKSFKFFDWVEGYIAHPLTGILDGVNYDEYLKEWREYRSEKQLKEWLEDGQSVRMIITCILRLVEAESTEGVEAKEALEAVAEEIKSIFQSYVDVI